jgi:glycosyltransferase involved in cell wall biosynthesis
MILPSNHSVPPTAGCSGISWLVHGLANHIDPNKYELTLLSIEKGTPVVSEADIHYSYYTINLGKTFNTLEWILKRTPYYIKRRLFFSSNERKIARSILLAWHARRIKSEVIVAHVYPTLVKVLSMCGVERGKVVFYFHTSDYADLPADILNFLNQYCKGLITIADVSVPKKVFVGKHVNILNALDKPTLSSIYYDLPTPAPALIYAGHITENKGLTFLIQAVKQLLKKYPTIQLHLAGKLPDESVDSVQYLEYIKKLINGHEKNILLRGQLDRAELLQIIPQCKVGLLLSQHQEGNSLFLTECILRGVPVIASAVGGNPLVVDDGVTGFVVPPDDVATICTKLELLLTDAVLYEQMRQNCLERGHQKFSFTRASHEFEQFMNQLNECYS